MGRDNRSPGFLNSSFLRETYSQPVAYGVEPAEVRWSQDGMRLAFLWNADGGLWKDVYLSDADGSLRRLTSREDSPPRVDEDDEGEQADQAYAAVMASGFEEIAWMPAGDAIMAIARGRVHEVRLDGASRVVFSGQPASMLRVPRRDSSAFFVSGPNVFALRGDAILQLTGFSKEDRKVRDFHASPDGRWIALFVDDESSVAKMRMPDYMPKKEVKIHETRRHNAGEGPPKRHYGIADASGSAKCILHSFDEHETFWPYSIRWLPNGEGALFALSSRDHKTFHIRYVSRSGESKTVYEETSHPWFAFRGMEASSCSNFVRFLSFRSGWCQIWEAPLSDGKPRPVTKTSFDIEEFWTAIRADEVFFTAYSETPVDRAVFRSKPGAAPEPIAVRSGCFRAFPNEDGESIAYLYSAACSPPKLLRADGPKMATLASCGDAIRERIGSAQIEMIQFRSRDKNNMWARLIKPQHFDTTKRYPVIFSCVYAGQAKNQFSRYHALDAFLANEMGYIVVGIDLRASIGYGREFFFGYHESLGIVDSDEIADAAAHLKTLPYIDSERIGIWGGSYGGFLTLMAMSRYPGEFHSGIAWKSVTEWRNYYEWYAGQRLGYPEDNADKYDLTSPLTHVANIQGNLLLVAGMQDDNVPFQDTVWIMQKLIENGKYFDLMIYPRDNHGLSLRHESLPDLMERIAAYFEDKMGLGPTS